MEESTRHLTSHMLCDPPGHQSHDMEQESNSLRPTALWEEPQPPIQALLLHDDKCSTEASSAPEKQKPTEMHGPPHGRLAPPRAIQACGEERIHVGRQAGWTSACGHRAVLCDHELYTDLRSLGFFCGVMDSTESFRVQLLPTPSHP